ncbi:5'-methylthioadenosine/S-adenosylhomocysteine nucleosidase [Myceligenerans pegani]|uniref:adenosylhomocysteine nucleosidase n=1 Tax=Myceligenerans pegani TaxID=2776917 RepID=A0ABR9MWN4_9MICO|nr:5'-methylthioadenosine/S-adenosylhomocysteine nucleosidase [Myceligenerans sp. TRM 65318]MBE1875406.1 5'-methylthioadenosine/S-adenosylhomocysteine nucleosidase [Myceligenerans sp. TRM 65318]MBE3017677.1 5'-methylthioadenosine/S-adenosylhomocysteine nucleosidase [Myceligenerans sp. TRM 65318]
MTAAPEGGAVDAVVIVAMPDEAAPFLDLAGVPRADAAASGITPDDGTGTGTASGDVRRPSSAPADDDGARPVSTMSDASGLGMSGGALPPGARMVGAAEHRVLTLGGRRIALVRSGIGFVNASDAAVGALLTYGIVPVVSAGSAGGLARSVEVGDVVVGRTYVNTGADATAFGYRLGQLPGMPAVYAADHGLLEATENAVGHEQNLVAGTIGSSEKFVTAEPARALRETFDQVLAVDMESAAIAQACHNHGAPFVSIRAVSDLCAPDGTEFLTHVDDAALRSARVVEATLTRL